MSWVVGEGAGLPLVPTPRPPRLDRCQRLRRAEGDGASTALPPPTNSCLRFGVEG
ncbi:MAG: hypothetical protein J0M33_01160 [Anaerolineae bacterium]|nr:hypothetical protein [Anaerolineae bacterium]